jgi:hypothetical protein
METTKSGLVSERERGSLGDLSPGLIEEGRWRV